jgi:hypothetical protein
MAEILLSPALRSTDLDLLLGRLLRLLGQLDLQKPVFVLGFDILGACSGGNPDRTGESTPLSLLDFGTALSVLLVPLGCARDGQAVVVEVDRDVFLSKARQFDEDNIVVLQASVSTLCEQQQRQGMPISSLLYVQLNRALDKNQS